MREFGTNARLDILDNSSEVHWQLSSMPSVTAVLRRLLVTKNNFDFLDQMVSKLNCRLESVRDVNM